MSDEMIDSIVKAIEEQNRTDQESNAIDRLRGEIKSIESTDTVAIPACLSFFAASSSISVAFVVMPHKNPFDLMHSAIPKKPGCSIGSPPVRQIIGLSLQDLRDSRVLSISLSDNDSPAAEQLLPQCLHFRLHLFVISKNSHLR